MRRSVPSLSSVVLLSGGMDSATCLAIAAREGPVRALTLYYGQRHDRELESARALARHYRVREHRVLRLPIAPLLESALTRRRIRIPARGPVAGAIPSTYVPARNTIFLALALGLAESRRADRILLGVNAVDYSGYPDCRPEFLDAFRRVARLATRVGVEGRTIRIVAPLLRSSKPAIVRRGERLGVPWELTWSCYAGGRNPCGRCDACRLRALGFEGAGVRDPLLGDRPDDRRQRPAATGRPGPTRPGRRSPYRPSSAWPSEGSPRGTRDIPA